MSSQVKAIFEFWGESEAELSFQVGDIITVIRRDDAGWWEGSLNGRTGLFPNNYVEEYQAPAGAPPSKPAPPLPPTTINTNAPPNPFKSALPPPANKPWSPPQATGRSPPPPGPPPASSATSAPKPPTVGVNARNLPDNKSTTFTPLSSSPAAAGSAATSSGAASSFNANPNAERKPAGTVRQGGTDEKAKAPKISKTKIGLWSSNIAFFSGIFMIPIGALSCLWYLVDSTHHTLQYLLSGAYSILIGMGIIWWESNFGIKRGPSRIPVRALVYFGLSIFMFFALATSFCGAFLLLASLTNFIATVLLKESYDAPNEGEKKKAQSDLVKSESFCDGLAAWFVMIQQQNKVGTLVFMTMYFCANIGLYGYTVQWWVDKNQSLPPLSRLSDYAPFAKGFGALLDLNCALIVVPVSRTLLRVLYNRSTADQGCFSKFLRAILTFIPLDQNIAFHKIIAKMILFAACGHITLHFINLAFAYNNTLDIFGTSAWVTGGCICFWMMIIYSATPENTRRGQFEIFWYSHHVFVLFFAFILFHGKGGINPHYWMYFIPCMTIYIAERLLRVYRASLPVVILSISLMDDVLSLEFAKEGIWEFESPKEGQYIFLQAPSISRIQWHPFTISSAPQENCVTVHIRVMGEGSWTRGLMEYMSTFGAKGKTFIQLDRLGPSGKLPGKIVGPDGKKILSIDGPHAAPARL